MGIIDSYLKNIQSKSNSNGMQPAVNTYEPLKTTNAIASPRSSAQEASTGGRSMSDIQERTFPKDEQQKGNQAYSSLQVAQGQQPVEPFTTQQIGSGVKQVYDVARLGNQAYDVITGIAAPTAAEAALTATTPEAAFILSDMGAATQAGYSGGVEMGAEIGAELGSEITSEAIVTSAGEGIGSAISGVVSVAAPYYALAKGGGMAINAITANNPGLRETPFGRLGRTLEHPVTGVERTFADMYAEAGIGSRDWNRGVAAVFNPIGGVFEALDGGCIIITACTDRNSYEVEIARKYRDKFLDKDQLRGYYYLAEKIVPILERSEKAKKFCKKWLVDKLVDYGEKRLGKRQRPAQLMSIITAKGFLATIKIVGLIIPHYVRANGEIY